MNRPEIRWTGAPAPLPSRTPARLSTTEAAFATERDRIFRRAWLAVARVETVARPGDFIRIDIPTTETAAILVRGDDGIVRAFHNRCAHRGVALVCEDRGNTRSFRCPYHAWLYGNDGALRGIPAAHEFPDVRKSETGLKPIACATWNGWVFINLSGEPRPALETFLGPLGEMFGDVPFHDYPAGVEMTQIVRGNWKSIINASGEGYHISSLHRDTLHPQVMTEDNPFQDFLDPRFLGLHTTGTLTRNTDWQPTGDVGRFVLSTMLPDLIAALQAMDAGHGIAAHPAVNRIGIPNFQIEAITLFPNSLIQIIPTGYLWLQFWPTAPGETLARIRLYSAQPPRTHREAFAAAHVRAQARDVVTEDIAMVELQQIGLASDPESDQIFGENEQLLRFFGEQIDRFSRADDVASLFT